MEKLKGMVNFDKRAKRAIVCCDCNRPIAYDFDRVCDRALIVLAVTNHTDHPRSDITAWQRHHLVTVDLVNKISTDGVSFESERVM